MAATATGEIVDTIDQDSFEGVRKGYDPAIGSHTIRRRSGWMELTTAYGYVTSLPTGYAGTSGNKIKWNGIEIDGVWAISSTVEEDNEKRQGRIVQDAILVGVVAGASDALKATALAALANIKISDNEILQLHGLFTGEGDGLAYIWKNLAATDAHETLLLGIADAAYVTQFGVGYEFHKKQFKREDNGTATFTLVFAKVAWAKAWTNAVKIGVDNESGSHVVETHEVDGVPTASLIAAIDAVAADSGYGIVSVRGAETGGGKGKISRRQAKQQANTNYYSQTWQAATGRRPEMETVVWQDLEESVATALVLAIKAGTASPSLAASHVLVSVSKTRHGGDPLWDVERVSWIPRVAGGVTAWGEVSYSYPERRPASGGGYETVTRTVSIQYYAAASGSTAAAYASGSNAPGGGIRLVANGALWEAKKVVDS